MAFLDKLGLKDALSKGLENQLARVNNKFCFEKQIATQEG